MATEELGVIFKAIKLMEDSIRITSNRKRYPVKYIQIIKRIQNTAIDIYEQLIDANRLKLDANKTERFMLQTKAITSCDKLSCYVEISLRLELIGIGVVEKWQKEINDVKYMAIAWRKGDEKR